MLIFPLTSLALSELSAKEEYSFNEEFKLNKVLTHSTF